MLLNANQGVGIEIAGSTTSPLVQDCHIQGGRRGIVICEGAKAKIEQCTVTESHFGIVILGQGTAPVVRDCQVQEDVINWSEVLHTGMSILWEILKILSDGSEALHIGISVL